MTQNIWQMSSILWGWGKSSCWYTELWKNLFEKSLRIFCEKKDKNYSFYSWRFKVREIYRGGPSLGSGKSNEAPELELTRLKMGLSMKIKGSVKENLLWLNVCTAGSPHPGQLWDMMSEHGPRELQSWIPTWGHHWIWAREIHHLWTRMQRSSIGHWQKNEVIAPEIGGTPSCWHLEGRIVPLQVDSAPKFLEKLQGGACLRRRGECWISPNRTWIIT